MPTEAELRDSICDIGRRLWQRQFVAGNDGNISCRLRDDVVLATPTMTSKGFLRPEDLCTVDLDGNQLSGPKRRTSEILLHLEIYKHDPAAQAVVHCHPPHPLAFALAGIEIPTGILPEVEIFLGTVPLGRYETPGTPEFAATIRPFVGQANTVILRNHGTVSWGPSLERACWCTETLDGYCRVLLLARQLGPIARLPEDKLRQLLALKENFGCPPDPRLATGRLYVNPDFARD